MRSQRILALLLIVTLSFAVRALTANFLRAHLNDPGWFPSGIYSKFDQHAQDWLDGRDSLFWINDASRTDLAIYPPGYAMWIAFIYRVSDSRSPARVQNVQWLLDSLSVLLIIGLGTTFGWRTGLWAGVIAALWPLLALYGVTPLPDAPTAWLVTGGTWAMMLAWKRGRYRWALVAGALWGISCWLRANAILLPLVAALVVLAVANFDRRRRMLIAAAVVISAALLISPIVVRNAIVFHSFIPVGLGVGTNLWEGLGETERGIKEFGAVYGDEALIEQERLQKGVSTEDAFDLYYPDGIQRDRERTRRALSVIIRHPFWYSGLVIKRAASLLKYAGEPDGIYGSSGVNMTPEKCLPLAQQHGVMALSVKILGMLQSVLRYILLPLIIVGGVIAVRRDAKVTMLLLVVVLYYLLIGSLLHTQFRYVLPMQMTLTIFAGITLSAAHSFLSRRFSSTPVTE